MSLREGDMVHLKGLGAALWRIDVLGERSFYADGSTCSEDSTELSLFLPSPQRPRCAYAQKTTSHRKFMTPVPEMVVIAMTVAAPEEAEERRIESNWKTRLKRLYQLQVQAATFKKHRERAAAKKRLKVFLKKNSDLFQTQKGFEADWEFVSRT